MSRKFDIWELRWPNVVAFPKAGTYFRSIDRLILPSGIKANHKLNWV